MRRREFITLVGSGLLAIVFFVGLAMFRANAQERTWRLGFLTPGAADAGTPGSVRETTLRVLADRGFSEGRNLIYFSAAAEGDLSRLPQLAKMLAEARVDVTIAVGTIAARAALTASNGTPIVLSFAAEDRTRG
jgi:putative ABC transport system substrate-binding protein